MGAGNPAAATALLVATAMAALSALTGGQELTPSAVDEDGRPLAVMPKQEDPGHVYTSMRDLEKFYEKEAEYVGDLKAVVDKKLVSAAAVPTLLNYVDSFEDATGGTGCCDSGFVHNPVNVYNLIRHAAVGWGSVEAALEEERARSTAAGQKKLPKRVRKVMGRRDDDFVPGAADLDGVSLGIVRLHDYYNFSLRSFVDNGVLRADWDGSWEESEPSAGEMTVWDAFKIGVRGANALMLGSGIDIMQEAYRKAQEDGVVSTPPFIETLDLKVLRNLIKTAKTVHDQKLDRWGPRTDTHSTNPVPYDRRLAKKKKFKDALKGPSSKPAVLGTVKISKVQEMEQQMELCRGRDLRPPSVRKRLTCKYESRGKAYYLIGPVKVEVVSLRPYIALMHGFVTGSEADDMILQASPKLQRSATLGASLNMSFNEMRVSETTWIHEETSGTAQRITDKLDHYLDVSALSTAHSELYQVVNYGLAGLYDVHYDAIYIANDASSEIQRRIVFNRHAGERYATVMAYLSDVEVGGYTVFPLAGCFVKPRKGSVVVWWNMDKAGGYDVLTRHAGCPVMLGSKWIANKWIRANSLMFKRPCPAYTRRQVREFRDSGQKLQKGEFVTDP